MIRVAHLFAATAIMAGAVLFACTGTEPNLDGSADGGAPAFDSGEAVAPGDSGAGASDSGTPTDGGLGPNLLDDPDFEEGNCHRWIPGEATADTETVNPHQGTVACRVCADGSYSYWGLSQYVRKDGLVDGGHYLASVWLRLADPDAGSISLQLGTDPHGYQSEDDLADETQTFTVRTSEWMQMTKTFQFLDSDKIESIEVGIVNRDTNSGCVVIDTASFALQQQ